MSAANYIVVFLCLCVSVGLVSLLIDANMRLQEMQDQLDLAGDHSSIKHHTTGSHVYSRSSDLVDVRNIMHDGKTVRTPAELHLRHRNSFFNVVSDHVARNASPAAATFLHQVTSNHLRMLGLKAVQRAINEALPTLPGTPKAIPCAVESERCFVPPGCLHDDGVHATILYGSAGPSGHLDLDPFGEPTAAAAATVSSQKIKLPHGNSAKPIKCERATFKNDPAPLASKQCWVLCKAKGYNPLKAESCPTAQATGNPSGGNTNTNTAQTRDRYDPERQILGEMSICAAPPPLSNPALPNNSDAGAISAEESALQDAVAGLCSTAERGAGMHLWLDCRFSRAFATAISSNSAKLNANVDGTIDNDGALDAGQLSQWIDRAWVTYFKGGPESTFAGMVSNLIR